MITLTIKSVRNPTWKNAEHTMLDVDVQFEELSFSVPFTAVDGEVTRHGQELWDRCKAGDFGKIAPYKAPEIPIEEIVKEVYP